MLQTINFSNEFDFKAIQEYITRISQVKRLNGHSVKMTVFKEFATDIAVPVRSRNIQDGLAILHKEYKDSEMTLPKIVNVDVFAFDKKKPFIIKITIRKLRLSRTETTLKFLLNLAICDAQRSKTSEKLFTN